MALIHRRREDPAVASIALFRDVGAFRRYLRRFPEGFVFGPGNALDTCPLAAWARSFDDRAVVACTHVAWDGTFGGQLVQRTTGWQEAFARRVVRHTLATGEMISRAVAFAILDEVAPNRSANAA